MLIGIVFAILMILIMRSSVQEVIGMFIALVVSWAIFTFAPFIFTALVYYWWLLALVGLIVFVIVKNQKKS
jgi:hypothetical protein